MKIFRLLAAVIALSASFSASASYLTYTSRDAFDTAAGNTTNIDFEAQNTAGNAFTYYPGLTVSGVNFANKASGYLFVAGTSNPAYRWNSGASLLFGSTNEGGNLTISLPSNVFSVGFDFMTENDYNPASTAGQTFGIDIDGMHFSGSTMQIPNRAFFGITSSTALSSITLSYTNTLSTRSLPIIDNLAFAGKAADVPEPASLALLASGLLGVAAARRRKEK